MQKAQEARNENDKGAMKDSASLLATNYIQEYYDRVYVQSDSTFRTSYANAGLYAKAQFPNATEGGFTYSISGNTLTVTDTKGNTVSGTILDNGNISWSDGTTPAGGGGQDTLPENAVVTLAKAGTIKVGDYVNYTPSSGSVTVTAAQTGADNGQTFSTEKNSGMTWRVLNVDSTTGEVKIVGTPTTQQLTLKGKAGFGNAETVLNNIAGIFGGGTGAASVRSITEDDVFDAIGYDKVSNYQGGTYTYTSGEWFTETLSGSTVTGYSSTTTIASTENPITLHNTAASDWITTASDTLEYGTEDEQTAMQIIWNMLFEQNNSALDYWCASRYVSCWDGGASYFVRRVFNQGISSGMSGQAGGEDGYPLAESNGTVEDVISFYHSVVPVVTLQSNIEIEQDTNDIWNFITE